MEFVEWRGERVSRIVLGTAQLGSDYGISNEAGKPDRASAAAIVRGALAGGVNAFDTARAYGESERVLGEILRGETPGPEGWRVVTKIDPGAARAGGEAVGAAWRDSLEKLGGGPLFLCMLHWAQSLADWGNGTGRALAGAKRRGEVRWLGVSCYAPEEALEALRHPEIDAVQVPCSAWDWRMEEAGVFAAAAAGGKLVFARSVFLQGLLLMEEGRVKERLPFAAGAAAAWRELAEEAGLSRRELAARAALACGCPLVVGAATADEARENAGLAGLPPLGENDLRRIRERMTPHLGERVLHPAKW